jgi:tetratricopeptide (TPR) repeat protein
MAKAAAKKIFHVMLAIAAGGSVVYAGDYSGAAAGTSSGKFLSLGSSARAAAMGEAYAAAPQDADAVRYNPAALVRVAANSAQVMHANYLADTSIEQGAFARRLGANQALGVSILQMSYGKIAETDDTGYQTGSAQPANLAVTGAYALELDNLSDLLNGGSVGLSVSYIRSTIVSTAKAFTASVGVLSPAYGSHETRLALVAENLFGSLKFDQKADPLPMSLKFGAMTRLREDWLVTLDLAGPKDNAPYAAVGTEKWFNRDAGPGLAVRAGYNILKARDLDGLSGFAAGIGVSFQKLLLDYAFVPFGGLGCAHKLTLTFNFGGERDDAAPKKPSRPAPIAPKPEPELEVQAVEPELPAEDIIAKAPEVKKTYQEYIGAANKYAAKKDHKNAVKEFNGALTILPEKDKRRVFILEQQGQLYVKLNNIAKAKEVYLAAIQTAKKLRISDTTVVNAHLGLAYCFEKSGSIPSAIKNYEKALGLSTNAKTKERIKKTLQKLKER